MQEFVDQLLAGERDAILFAAAFYFLLMAVLATIQMVRLSRWPSVIGDLRKEGIGLDWADGFRPDENEYSAHVQYEYIVNGQIHEGDRLNPWSAMATHNLRNLLRVQFRWIERRDGDRVRVYYNPRNPEKSYLHVPGWRAIALVVGLCLGSAALVLSGL